MEAAVYRSRALHEVDPHSEWVEGDEFDTLILDVSGFSKDQLHVQVDPSGPSLRIRGDCAVNGGERRRHFLKRFDLPAGCDCSAIKVQLDKGVLYVQVPRGRLVRGDATVAAANDDSSSEQLYEDALREHGDGGATIWGGRAPAARQGWAWRLAESLSKHRQVILNVVLAVVLLWLVAFAKNKSSGGQAKNE